MSEKTTSKKLDDAITIIKRLSKDVAENKKNLNKTYLNYLIIKKHLEVIFEEVKKSKNNSALFTRKQKTTFLWLVGGVVCIILFLLVFIGIKINVLPVDFIQRLL